MSKVEFDRDDYLRRKDAEVIKKVLSKHGSDHPVVKGLIKSYKEKFLPYYDYQKLVSILGFDPEEKLK